MRRRIDWLRARVGIRRRAAVVGPYILLTSDGEHGHGGPHFLFLLKHDFQTVLLMVRWPRRWWPK